MNCPPARLTPAGLAALQNCDWPANIRELHNVIERAVIVARGGAMEFDLPITTPARSASPPDTAPREEREYLTEPEMLRKERDNLLVILEKTGWKIKGADGAAELLGIKPTTLLSRINKMGLRRKKNPERPSKSCDYGWPERCNGTARLFVGGTACTLLAASLPQGASLPPRPPSHRSCLGHYVRRSPLGGRAFQTPFFVCAIVLSSWIVGAGPGIAATLFSIFAIEYTFTESRYTLGMTWSEVPKFTVLLLAGVFISLLARQQRRDEEALLVARESLEEKVRKRTADLESGEELSLAHDRQPFSRLSPAARRAWGPALRHD